MKDRGNAATTGTDTADVQSLGLSAIGGTSLGEDVDSMESIDWSALIDAVAAGRLRLVVHSPSGSRAVLVSESALAGADPFTGRPVVATATNLTKREQEILLLLEQGNSGGEIAEYLGLAVNTVAQHLASARRRFGVRSSAEAARRAREAGLL